MRYKKAGEGLTKRITHALLEMDVEHIYPMEKHATIKHPLKTYPGRELLYSIG